MSDSIVVVNGNVYKATTDTTFCAISNETKIVTIPSGLPGPPGPPGGNLIVPAGEAISALKPIVIIGGVAYAADNTDPTHDGLVVGVSITAVSQGGNVTVATTGVRITDNSWNWTNDTVFVGNKTLTQSPPVSGVLQAIGVVVNSNSIIVNVGDVTER